MDAAPAVDITFKEVPATEASRHRIGSAPRIYVAGPYSRGIPDETMAKVADAAEALATAGLAPFIPHTMTFLWAVRYQHPVQFWYDFDMEWLAACDAVVRLPGASTGADKEVEWAIEKGKPIFHSVEECIAYYQKRQVRIAVPAQVAP